MSAIFKHIDLKLVEPAFDSKLTSLILELDHLRKKKLGGSTHPLIFFQLKNIYHLLESIGSARIEGNRTTLSEYIESIIENKISKDEKKIEINNMTEAHNFIDENILDSKIDRKFVSEIHKMVVKNLSVSGEGSINPGCYRKKDVTITRSEHKPPNTILVTDYMDKLFSFFNHNDVTQYDLLKTAIAHHRFAWVHPFDNGNGRTARLLTYAMLVKQGFNVKAGRIINPTAIFCVNRDDYYEKLSIADNGQESSMLIWCEYVLTGLKKEIDNIDRLLDYKFLSKNILLPTVKLSLENKMITPNESKILNLAINKRVIQAGEIKELFPKKLSPEISRMIGRLKKKKMLLTEKKNSRKYILSFDNNYLLRGVIEMLDKHGFISSL